MENSKLEKLYKILENDCDKPINANDICDRHKSLSNGIIIKDVCFSKNNTIVLWSDGSETSVRLRDDEIFDKEKALALAITKRLSGNNHAYNQEIAYWIKKKGQNS